jgi:hypothetical protein
LAGAAAIICDIFFSLALTAMVSIGLLRHVNEVNWCSVIWQI